MAKKKSKRVNFSKYKPIHDRGFNPAYMEEIQDSLIARNYNEPQRLAFLSTALHESGGDPKAVAKGKDKNGKSVKFSGLYQWGDDRFPNSWNLGDQIHYALESAESKDTKASWSHGGSGIPKINNALEGREAFWNSKNPYEATLYFNKGYVRPAEEQARINRAEEAANMAKNLFWPGGPLETLVANPSRNNTGYVLSPEQKTLLKEHNNSVSVPNMNKVRTVATQNVAPILDEGPDLEQVDTSGIFKKTWGEQSSEAWNNAWKSENIGNSLTSIAGGLTDITQSTMANAKIKDTTGIQTAIDAAANTTFGGSTNEQLMSQYDAIEDLDRTSQRDLTGSVGSKLANTGKATLSGVQAGMQIGGPIGCVCAGTRILTNTGEYKNIENLYQNEGIIGWGNNSSEKQDIIMMAGCYYKKCLRIILQSGTYLDCSIDHPILAIKKGRQPRQYINGRRVRVKNYQYINAENLNIGDKIAIAGDIDIWGKEVLNNAYLIGLLLGDGSYSKEHSVRLATGDRSTWEYVENNNLGILLPYENNFKDKCQKEFRIYTIIDGINNLRRLGIYGQTKFNKRLPINIHLYNKESIQQLIAGLIDSDGCVMYKPNQVGSTRIEFSQSNYKLLIQVREQLFKLGIFSSIVIKKPHTSYYRGKKIVSKTSYRLVIKDKMSLLRFYKQIPLNISYKKENLKKIIEDINKDYYKNYSLYHNLFADPVECIIDLGVQRIYNLEAKGNHNYIANSIITHNSIIGGAAGLISSGIGWAVGDTKAQNEAERLNREAEAAEQRRLANFDLAVNNLEQQNLMYDMANYAKYGGKINIKPSKRGTFTRAAKSRGLGVQEFASKVLANPDDYSEAMRKKAQFAKNASKWKHEDGGPLFNEFSNGITLVNNGGSHESNPNEGIQVGVDQEGIPNLVEEGEVIFNNYVFSNRLVVPDKVRTKYKLRDTKDLSFADAAKDIQKMSEEMPNDPIVKRTMETQMQELMMEQEQVRMKKDRNKRNNKFAKGGIISPLEYIEPALSVGQGLQSLFIKPDYRHLDAYDDAINAANVKVSSSPVKTNMRYTPMDTRGLLSEASANRAATNRALMNTSGANPAIARTALTNADYNYNNQLGKLWRSIEEAEYNRQLGFEQFRTNLENANRARDLQVAGINADILAKNAALRGDFANRQLAIDNATSAVISGNIDAAKQSLAGLARQSTYADWVKMMQENGVLVGPDGSMVKLKKEAKNGGKIKRRRRLS